MKYKVVYDSGYCIMAWNAEKKIFVEWQYDLYHTEYAAYADAENAMHTAKKMLVDGGLSDLADYVGIEIDGMTEKQFRKSVYDLARSDMENIYMTDDEIKKETDAASVPDLIAYYESVTA